MYIQIYQIHGLIRAKNLELGIDEDTGGQIISVIEMAKALGSFQEVSRVEIVTRMFKDDDHPGYSKPFEPINNKVSIVRIPCGPSEYIKKVDLNKYLDEFYENAHYYIDTDDQIPDIIHSNYYDSGYVCNKLAKDFDIPHVFAAHSLGKPKYKELQSIYKNPDELDSIYHFKQRIPSEQEIIDNANILMVFCEQEKQDQYSDYDVDQKDPRFKVIYPGVNAERFKPFWDEGVNKDEKQIKIREKLENKINSGLEEPDKPFILMLSRLEPKKNVTNMLECFRDDKELQKSVNLVICAGRTSDRSKLTSEQLRLLTHFEKIIEDGGLKGKVNLIDEVNYVEEVPELYRIVGRKRGVFVDCDITDPLPLTIIEAALSGIPVVAHSACALLSIISKGKQELLINVKKHHLLSMAILKLVNNHELYDHCARAGVECILNELTWDVMAKKVLDVYKSISK